MEGSVHGCKHECSDPCFTRFLKGGQEYIGWSSMKMLLEQQGAFEGAGRGKPEAFGIGPDVESSSLSLSEGLAPILHILQWFLRRLLRRLVSHY